MITKEQAIALGAGALRGPIYSMQAVTGRGKNQRPTECRVNGRCQTWATRPGEFRLPIKAGFRNTFQMWHYSASEFTLDENEARRALGLPEVQS